MSKDKLLPECGYCDGRNGWFDHSEDCENNPENIITKLQAENDRLLNTVKLAYRKHHLDDRSVGWEELSNALFNTLCDAMGDIGFDEWLKKQRKGC